LTIGDGLFAAKVFDKAPAAWNTFGGQLPNSLFFSVDKVSIDCVMHDLLAAELGSALNARAGQYLQLAGQAGLGLYEHGNPWLEPIGTGYQNIRYTRIDI